MTASPVSPPPDAAPRTVPDATTLGVLGRYLRPLWPQALVLALLLLGSIGLSLYLPQLLARFLDTAQARGPLSELTRLAGLYILLAVGVQLLSAGATFMGAQVGWLATNRLRVDLMRHLLSLDLSFHKNRTPGELIERVDGDVTALSNFFSQFTVRVFGAALLLVGALVMFWREVWWVGLGVTVFAAFTLWAMNRVRRLGVDATTQEREASARLFGFVEERLTGLEDVRALGGGQHTLTRFLGVQRHYFWRAFEAWGRRSVVWRLSMLLFAVGYVGVLSAAVGLYAAGSLTLGSAFLFYQYMSLVEEPIDQLTQQLQDLQKAGASLQRVGELLRLRPGLPTGTAQLPASGPLTLSFEDVSFSYDGDDSPVLKDVSFTLAAGRHAGLLGRTGSGKTTLTRLVSRLYDPSLGAVRLNGLPVGDIAPASLRRRVAVVTQDVQLFQAPVRDNLTFFDAAVPDERVEAALHEVGLGEWLARLPGGLHAQLAAGSLSAGEAQLLAFARVMLQDPGLIILDEPSSRLDPATETQLTRAMERLLHGRTAVIIAHRLDTVARAGDILVLGGGEVLEHGPRETLARDPRSHYARLLRASRAQQEEVLA